MSDLFVILGFYVILSAFFIYKGIRSSKSGSQVKVPTGYPGGYKYEDRPNENVPFWKTGWAAIWVVFTLFWIFIFILIGSDRWDLWFG